MTLWLCIIPITFAVYCAYQTGLCSGAERALAQELRKRLLDLERKRYAAAAEFAWDGEPPDKIERLAAEIGGEYLRTDWTVR